MSPLTVHFQFSDTISTLFRTLFPHSLCFNLFSLQKETTGLASAQPSSAIPLAQSSWKHNSWNDNLRTAQARARVSSPSSYSPWETLQSRVTSLLGRKKNPSGNRTIINKSCSWMVYLVPGSIPERGDWKYSIQPVWPLSLGTLPGLPTTHRFMDLAHNVD